MRNKEQTPQKATRQSILVSSSRSCCGRSNVTSRRLSLTLAGSTLQRRTITRNIFLGMIQELEVNDKLHTKDRLHLVDTTNSTPLQHDTSQLDDANNAADARTSWRSAT